MRVETITRKLYTYSELEPKAQSKARDWYRAASAGDNYFTESITDELVDTCEALGWNLTGRDGKPQVYWSGFWCQGDGACFVGTWSASRLDRDRVAAIILDRPEVGADGASIPDNAETARILHEYLRLAAVFPDSAGTSEHRGHYSHSHNVAVEFDTGEELDTDAKQDAAALAAAEFAAASRDLMDQFYRNLEKEWEYRNSDEAVTEDIEANDYEFLEDGTRA